MYKLWNEKQVVKPIKIGVFLQHNNGRQIPSLKKFGISFRKMEQSEKFPNRFQSLTIEIKL